MRVYTHTHTHTHTCLHHLHMHKHVSMSSGWEIEGVGVSMCRGQMPDTYLSMFIQRETGIVWCIEWVSEVI